MKIKDFERPAAGLTVFSMLLSLFIPVSVVYAQELPTGIDTVVDSPAPATAPIIDSIDTTPDVSQDIFLNESLPQADTSIPESTIPNPSGISEDSSLLPAVDPLPEEEAIDPPSALLSSEEGDVPNSARMLHRKSAMPEINEFSGSLDYKVPIVVPPGRNGLQPNLNLSYSSNDFNKSSYFGQGWSIDIPYIQRVNRIGVDKLYSTTTTNYFESSMSGELAYSSSTDTYKSKVEDGSFFDYDFSSDLWTVRDKQGITYTFGSATSTRQDNASSTDQIFKWMLDEARDTNDNYIKYTYYKENGQIYPDQITYTGHDTTDGIFTVNFLRESGNYAATTTSAGFPVKTKQRIDEIQAKIDGSWVRKYELTYDYLDNASTTAISAIQETGRDEITGNSVTLPQNFYSYSTSTKSWTEQTTDWEFPSTLTFTDMNGKDTGIRVEDFNGDGLADIFMSFYDYSISTLYNYAYINNGSGWTEDEDWEIPLAFANSYQDETGVRIGDVNGDNLPDLVKVLAGTGGASTTQEVYINNGSGWTDETDTWIPETLDNFNIGVTNGKNAGGQILDINGDGLADFVSATWFGSGDLRTKVYLNNGSGWTEDDSWGFDNDFIIYNYVSGHDQGFRFADINGDGLVDGLQSYYEYSVNNQKVYINNGSGWDETSNWTIPSAITFTNGEGLDRGGRVADLNGDGLADLFYVNRDDTYGATTKYVFINNGDNGWTDETDTWTFPSLAFSSFTGLDIGTRAVDFNGDAVVDILVGYDEPTGPNDQRTFLHDGEKTDLVSQITHNTGGITGVGYKAAQQYMNGSTLLNPDLPFVVNTVDTITTSDGFGNSSTVTYSYEDGDYYYSDALDRKFAGFGTVMKTDPDGNITNTYFHQGNSSNSSQGEYSDHVSKIGKVYRTEVYDDSSDLYSKTINKWDRYDLGDDAYFVKLAQSVESAYNGDERHKDKAESYTYDNDTGNLTEKIEWGEVIGSDNGTFSDTGADKFTTDFSYAASTTLHIIGLPSQETREDQNANKVKETKYYYDDLSSGNVSKGNLTKQEDWKSSTNYIDVERTYNSYGLVTQEKDPRDKTTDFVYEGNNLYVATSTNAESLVTEYYYDLSSGKVSTTTDSNINSFATTYDGLDRILTQKQPNVTTTSTMETVVSYTYTDTSGAVVVQKIENLDASTSVDTYMYFDGLGRLIQTRKEAESSYSVTDVAYNELGQTASESLPYFSSGSSRTTATTSPNLMVSYEYDPLLRVTSIQNAISFTTNTYADWQVTVNDMNDHDKTLYKDAFGNLIQVDEVNATSTYSTLYEYDGNNNLTKITDALGNIRNFTYDGLSRRLTAQDLHASGDGTYGTWTYTYDDSGNMIEIVDPKSQTITFTYDDINRVLTEDYTGQGGTEVTYTYDDCTQGKSRLCSAVATNATTTYAYNPLGQLTGETKTIDSTYYDTGYTYDRLGNIVTVTYPDENEVKYEYNSAGLLEAVSQKETGEESYSYILEAIDYHPSGKITYLDFGNGTETTYTYDQDQLYRLTRKLTTNPGAEMMMGAGFGSGLGLSESQSLTAAKDVNQINLIDLTESVLQEEYNFSAVISSDYDLEKAVFVKNQGEIRIEVGDSTEGKFIPQLRLSRWDGEVSLKVTPASDAMTGQGLLSLDGKTIKFLNAQEEYRFYSIDPDVSHEGGAYEFEAVFDEKPESNTVAFDIESRNLSFFYQPPLNEEQELKGLNCTEIECTDESGEVVLARPENVVGSYAVYHSEKSGDLSKRGGNNYRSGKAFHIYRPKITDASGAWTWGELNINEKSGTLTVTVSQVFLDNAEYPIIVDPTFGYTTAGGSTRSLADNYMYLKTGTPASSGDVDSVSIYARESSGSSNFKGVIVNDASGPNAIVTNGVGAATGFSSQGWHTSTYSTRPSITGSTTYYPSAVVLENFIAYLYYDSSSSGDGYDDNSNSYASPTNPSDAYTLSSRFSIYATYTEGGGGNNAPSEPTDILTEGQTNPTAVTDSTPEFSAIYNDLDNGDIATDYQLQVATSTAFTSPYWDSAKTALASSTPEGTRIADISYGGSAFASSTTYYLRVKFWDDEDAEGDWSTTTATFILQEGNAAPEEPTDLLTEGQTNPTNIQDPTPEFSAIYNDPNSGDLATDYQFQIATSTAFTSPYWDSTKTSLASSTPEGTRIADISYGGSQLASTTPYYWRIKFWDDENAEGSWSTTTASFTLAVRPNDEPLAVNVIQNLNYTYDNVGNITNIAEYGQTGLGRIINYTYDDLYRLTSASTAQASSTLYYIDYTYNAVGNVISKSDVGNYTYAGTGYANPHAATSINGSTYSYDNNGNLTSDNTWNFSWDYNNRLTEATTGIAISTFAYDHAGQRVSMSDGSTTTVYPNKYYNTDGTTPVKHVFLGDELIATILSGSAGGGGATSTAWLAAGTVETTGNWINFTTTRLGTSDNSDATCTSTSTCDDDTAFGDSGEVSDFTFGIPQDATIDGIEVQVEAACYGIFCGSSDDISVKLSWNDGSNYTTQQSTGTLSDSDVTYTLGSSSDDWGHSWTDDELSDGTFRMKVEADCGSQCSSNRKAEIDLVQVKVYYTSTGGGGASSTVQYIHTDHLSGSSVITNSNGEVIQALDYYPYGDLRINDQYTEFDEQRKFTGHEYDADTGLSYMGARYYNPGVARFLSQDQAFLAVGDPQFKNKYNRTLEQHLTNPQALNSYSYANGNPLTFRDENGEILPLLAIGAAVWAAAELGLSAYDVYSTFQTFRDPGATSGEKILSAGLALASIAGPGGGYKGALNKLDNLFGASKAAKGGIWSANSLERGRTIEKALGQNLPGNFPVIDRFENGIVTSIKSLDLNAKTYQNASNLRSTLTNYIDSVAGFNGRNWAGVNIRSGDISGRALDLAVPYGGSTAQQSVIQQSVEYGASQGVKVI